MKDKQLHIFILFFFGVVLCSFAHAKPAHASVQAHYGITAKASHSRQHPTGESPFIRFHHGIDESGVTISLQHVLIIPLKPVDTTPEKYAGIGEYLSGFYYLVPVAEAFLYCRPLRSPPVYC